MNLRYYVIKNMFSNIRAQLVGKMVKKVQLSHETGTSWILIIFVLLTLAFSVSYFSPATLSEDLNVVPTQTEARQPRVYTVSYKAGVFGPTNLRIHAGDTVRFRNNGLLSIRIVSDPHPTHDGLPGFDSIGDIPLNGLFAFTFSVPGTFGYHNERNADEAGMIIVRQ